MDQVKTPLGSLAVREAGNGWEENGVGQGTEVFFMKWKSLV